MKPNFRTCPQCSTGNRLDKEFCVKCGEPLEGVKAGDPNEAPKKGKPGIFLSRDGDEAPGIAANREYTRRAAGANDLRTIAARIEQLQASLDQ